MIRVRPILAVLTVVFTATALLWLSPSLATASYAAGPSCAKNQSCPVGNTAELTLPPPEDPPPEEPGTDETPGESVLPVEPVEYEPPPPPRCLDQDVEINPGDYHGESDYQKWVARSDRPDDPDAYAVERMCRDLDEPCETVDECDYTLSEGWDWRVPGQEPPPDDPGQPQGPADPEAVAEELYAEVLALLPPPRVDPNPGMDRATVVGLPTFVSVTNWETVEVDDQCDPSGFVCVDIVAEPTGIVYDPGEPGVGAVDCEGPGQPYQPGTAANAEEQASWPETCTHTYEMRTGVDNRPDAWGAEVSIVWDVTGTSTIQPEPENLGPVVSTTTFPREVNEVQSVVTD